MLIGGNHQSLYTVTPSILLVLPNISSDPFFLFPFLLSAQEASSSMIWGLSTHPLPVLACP